MHKLLSTIKPHISDLSLAVRWQERLVWWATLLNNASSFNPAALTDNLIDQHQHYWLGFVQFRYWKPFPLYGLLICTGIYGQAFGAMHVRPNICNLGNPEREGGGVHSVFQLYVTIFAHVNPKCTRFQVCYVVYQYHTTTVYRSLNLEQLISQPMIVQVHYTRVFTDE